MFKHISLFTALMLAVKILFAQIPNGYYDSAEGLTSSQLKVALHNIIAGHTKVDPYDYFYITDSRPDNGKVWDIYSDNPDGAEEYYFTFETDKCGNYSQEGDCYNREHSWPQSWVNNQDMPCEDMHAIFPTDGWVNGKRSNLPYGEVSNPNYTSSNGSKKGNNTTQGYSQEVFEPIDEYKGDIARAYFYITTRYYSEDSGWDSNDMVTKSVINEWALNMLLNWHENDPVSQKEIDRNNQIYLIQENRNPFIDHPEYVDAIWDPNYEYVSTIYSNKITLFPNPAQENFSIMLNEIEPITSINIYNTIGICIAHYEQLPVNGTISCEDFSKGIYIVRIIGSKGSYSARLIKE
jgi:endonuclease I